MAKKNKKAKVEKPVKSKDPVKRRNRLFKLIIIVFSFVLYGNTIYNHYSLDDYHISAEDALLEEGISAIPEIFTSTYAEEGGMNYVYSHLTRFGLGIYYELVVEGT